MDLIERLELRLEQAKEKQAKKETKKQAKLLQKKELKDKQALIKEAIKAKDFANAEKMIAELKHSVDLDRVVFPVEKLIKCLPM